MYTYPISSVSLEHSNILRITQMGVSREVVVGGFSSIRGHSMQP